MGGAVTFGTARRGLSGLRPHPVLSSLYLWYSEEGTGRAAAPPSSLLAAPNVTAHPSTASVPINVLL